MIGPFRRRRSLSVPLALQTLDVGNRVITLEVTSAVRTLARVREALDARHPYRAAVLDVISDTATRALCHTPASARNGSPLRLTLTVSATAARIEARGAGIDEAAGARHAAGRLATRSGLAFADSGLTIWWAYGEPLTGEQLALP